MLNQGFESSSLLLRLGIVTLMTGFLGCQSIDAIGRDESQSFLSQSAIARSAFVHSGTVSDLGTLDDARDSRANGINNAGQITGFSQSQRGGHAVRWERDGSIRDLGTLTVDGSGESEGWGITADGQVVGVSATDNGERHAFLWSESSGMRDLGTLPGGNYSQALTPSPSGLIAGTSTTANGEQHAVIWRNGQIEDLGTLGSSYSAAVAVNDAGTAVGVSNPGPFRPQHAFRWTREEGMIDLGTLGGDQSAALSINAAGDVVGLSTTASGEPHAVLWTRQGEMVDLGTLPGGVRSWANSIDNSGRIVGVATSPFGNGIQVERAVMWSPELTIRELGGLEDPARGTRSEARAISDNGLIVGSAERSTGGFRATLWSGFLSGRE